MEPGGYVKRGFLVVAFVLLSSWFGLTGKDLAFLTEPAGAADFFAEVWSDSLLADAIFTFGTIAAGLACYQLAARANWLIVAVASAAANWLVYTLSFIALDMSGGPRPDAPMFVLEWGWMGLLFCALAIPVARWRLDGVETADDVEARAV